MRVSDENLNKQIAILINDKMHRRFKTACASRGLEMASELRRMIREYVEGKKK